MKECSKNRKINRFYIFNIILKFIIDIIKEGYVYSEELIKVLGQELIKLSYMPLNRQFIFMDAFIILYKMVINSKVFKGSELHLHLALTVSVFFYDPNI